ncbi:cytochrome P450 [Cercophora samala]|uniref:Cytochrome P450 n=1 Tax=Cercophora samala TaxID=330535 RepID=A0AA39ZBK4_9PEZI|nr:cytochrome P450 [Cercophora samala]
MRGYHSVKTTQHPGRLCTSQAKFPCTRQSTIRLRRIGNKTMAFKVYLAAPSMAVTATLLAIVSVIARIINNLLFSSLPASLPGPFIAKISNIWITIVDLSGLRAQVLHRLHQKHGPVIRIGPKELSFSDPGAITTIYGPGTTCVKSPAYNNFGRQGMFQMQNPDQHRHRQRRVSHIFGTTSTSQVEPLVQRVVNNLVSTMQSKIELDKEKHAVVDMLHWCRMMALDVSGEVLMGKSFGTLETGDTKEKRDGARYVRHLDATYTLVGLQSFCPPIARLMGLLPVERLQVLARSWDVVYQYGEEALREYVKQHGRTGGEVLDTAGMKRRKTLLSKLVQGNEELGTEPLADDEISVEISNITFAATDTTGTTAAYALYRLACNKAWQDRLREELRQCRIREGKPSDEDLSFATLQSLPLLHGVVMETLRLDSSVPSSLPRMTTRLLPPGTVIGGVTLPPGTLVSMQAYTLHRDPGIYGDNPELFNPARWISGDVGSVQRMQDSLFAFGGPKEGPRTCPGQHLALMELKLALAALTWRFDISLKGPNTHEEMEMRSYFSLVPKGHRCSLLLCNI